MEAWQEEIKQAVEAGEREFGLLDAHQTVKHNLVHRCEEILGDHAREMVREVRSGVWAVDGTD